MCQPHFKPHVLKENRGQWGGDREKIPLQQVSHFNQLPEWSRKSPVDVVNQICSNSSLTTRNNSNMCTVTAAGRCRQDISQGRVVKRRVKVILEKREVQRVVIHTLDQLGWWLELPMKLICEAGVFESTWERESFIHSVIFNSYSSMCLLSY